MSWQIAREAYVFNDDKSATGMLLRQGGLIPWTQLVLGWLSRSLSLEWHTWSSDDSAPPPPCE